MMPVHPFSFGAGAVFVVAAVVIYRRRSGAGERYGSQGAVFLLLVGLITLMHGLGLFEYRPSQGELDRAAAQAAERRAQ